MPQNAMRLHKIVMTILSICDLIQIFPQQAIHPQKNQILCISIDDHNQPEI